jgi:purine-binding chemotaxis protein CheW
MSDPDAPLPAAAQATLRARAIALARPDETPAAQHPIELLEFHLARDRYALETQHVAEVLPLAGLTPVPCTPAFVGGVVNVRGRIITVIDLQKFFGLPVRGLNDLHHVVLVQAGEFQLGLLADTIVGVRAYPREALQPPLPAPTGVPHDYLMGMTADRLLVLDLQRLVADPRLVVNEGVKP